MPADANDEPNVGKENRPTDSRSTNDDDGIAEKVKSTMKDLVANELSTLIEESLDDILRMSLHNAQSEIRSFVYNVIEQAMLVLPRREVIRDTWNVQTENLFHTDAAADRLSQRFITANTFMEPIATFVRRKPDNAMKQKYSTAQYCISSDGYDVYCRDE